jgi:Fe-S oxidoreductase
MLQSPGAGRLARNAAGIEARRSLPAFAPTTFRSWYGNQERARGSEGKPVVLLIDTFTNYFAPDIAVAAMKVLERAGFSVSIPDRPTCCAITWISTGQLGAARRILRRTVNELLATAQSGIPIVGLEPSCTATLRSDAVDILDTADSEVVASSVKTLSEVLATASGWVPPSMSDARVVAQPHCHQHAISGWQADAEVLRRTGADVTRVAGCCGLAGNFGVERGHYDISVAVARTALLPAVEAAADDAVLLADGFSCRTQLADLAGRKSMHIAQFLASGLSASA